MGGRGTFRWGQFAGPGLLNTKTGEVIMASGMHRTIPSHVELTAAQKQRMLTMDQGAAELRKGLLKSGVNLTAAESKDLVSSLALTGSLFGSGNMRTRLYKTGRFLGDWQAVAGGSKTLQRRIMRRMAGRVTGKTFRKLFK